MTKDTLKKILGTMTVIMLTFILPAIVTTVTSPSTLDNRSSAETQTGSNDVSVQQNTNTKDNSLLSKVYPVVLGTIVFLWFVTILVYLGYKGKKPQ